MTPSRRAEITRMGMDAARRFLAGWPVHWHTFGTEAEATLYRRVFDDAARRRAS